MFECTPPELREAAEETVAELLPKKSKEAYDQQYILFKQWCTIHKAEHASENVLIAYFQEQGKSIKSTMWSTYSMLRSCLNVYENLDISKYLKLQAYLKRLSDGYKPKKSKILESDEINRFITEADDTCYLALKELLSISFIKAGFISSIDIPQLYYSFP